MTVEKITSDLSSRINDLPNGKKLQVIVELSPDAQNLNNSAATRQEKMKRMKDQFQAGVEAITAILGKNGGKVIESAWINQSLRVEVTKSALSRLTDLHEVASIDTPRQLSADFNG
jgi:hypothetical protein